MASKNLNINILKLIAQNQRMSVKEFAKSVDMGFQGWHRAESAGDMKMSTFFKACEVLGIEDSVLIKGLNPNYEGTIEEFVTTTIAGEPTAEFNTISFLEVLKFVDENKPDLLELMRQMKAKKSNK